MEQNSTSTIAGSFAINLVDLPGSTGKQHAWSAAVSKLFTNCSPEPSEDIVTAHAFQKLLTIKLQHWVKREDKQSQRHFWKFFDNVRDCVAVTREGTHRNIFVAHELAHWVLGGTQNDSVSRPSQHSLDNVWPAVVIDGQRRLAAVSANRDLSGRAIRLALETAIKELDSVEDANTICDVLEVLDGSLTQEVYRRIRWVDALHGIEPAGNTAPSTREWVLGFLFRTGNPPPGTGLSCPADGWAIVIITEAWREGYATIQRQEVLRDLRNTICTHGATARFNRGTQSHANHGGGRQPARYWHLRPNHSLARCA